MDQAALEKMRERFRAWCEKHHRNGKRASRLQQETYLLELDRGLSRDELREIRKSVHPDWLKTGVIAHWKKLYTRDLEASFAEDWISQHET